MFKSKKKSPGEQVEEKMVTPAKTVAQVEAEKAIARGERIKRLSGEAAMWRAFAASCKPGRSIFEHVRLAIYGDDLNYCHALSVDMDEDSAPLWAAFANQMTEERERRLKDVLGI